jgi:hypothetical protein
MTPRSFRTFMFVYAGVLAVAPFMPIAVGLVAARLLVR